MIKNSSHYNDFNYRKDKGVMTTAHIIIYLMRLKERRGTVEISLAVWSKGGVLKTNFEREGGIVWKGGMQKGREDGGEEVGKNRVEEFNKVEGEWGGQYKE